MSTFLPRKSWKSTLALFLIVALLNLFLFPFLAQKVNAGTFTSAKLTISDSRAGQTSVTYDFSEVWTVNTAIKQVDIQICTTASGTCTAPTGFSSGTPTLGSDNLTGTGRTTSAPTANAFRVVVTTPATQTGTPLTLSFTGVTNPTTANTTYFARITTYSDTGTTVIDTATVAFAILTSTSIAVTASVDPTLTFTVAAVNSGTVNGATINVTTSTAILIPFGTLTSGSTKIAAHDLSVTTNATNGYTITVKAAANPPLSDSATSENIDNFTGTNATPTTWSSPAGTAKSVNTGFFGYTTNDATLGTGTANRFTSAGNVWAGTTTSPLEVAFSSVGVSSAETTRAGWQAEVNGLQPAGSYSGTVVLVATPTY